MDWVLILVFNNTGVLACSVEPEKLRFEEEEISFTLMDLSFTCLFIHTGRTASLVNPTKATLQEGRGFR